VAGNRNCFRNRALNERCGVSREPLSSAIRRALSCAQQAAVPFLDQIQNAGLIPAITVCDRHHQLKVDLYQTRTGVFRPFVFRAKVPEACHLFRTIHWWNVFEMCQIHLTRIVKKRALVVHSQRCFQIKCTL